MKHFLHLGSGPKHKNQTTKAFDSPDWLELRLVIDIIYGHRAPMAAGNLFMAHRCGFTKKVLIATLQASGFQSLAVMERPKFFDLWALGSKLLMNEDSLLHLAGSHFPAG